MPPLRSVDGSCGLMSLVVPTSALPPAEGTSCLPEEQPDRTTATAVPAASRRIIALRGPDECDFASARQKVTETMLAAGRIWLRNSGQQLSGVFVLRVAEDIVGVAVIRRSPAVCRK